MSWFLLSVMGSLPGACYQLAWLWDLHRYAQEGTFCLGTFVLTTPCTWD